jgi:ornithine carbamoyltransferase
MAFTLRNRSFLKELDFSTEELGYLLMLAADLGRTFDGIEYRGFAQQRLETLAEFAGMPVWNGLTDEFHPAQILADMC